MPPQEEIKEKKIFGVPKNVFSMSAVSFLNDLSSEMVFMYIPIFLTTVLGASVAFVGLIEGVADATASILRIVAGRLSDKWGKRKSLVVFGYSLSAISKPILAIAMAPWHVLVIRFFDRAGKGIREAPRDALISASADKEAVGHAFGFSRGADRLGATFGLILASILMPLLDNNYRKLFLLSFIASFIAVLALIIFVREIKPKVSHPEAPKVKFEFKNLGAPFIVFLIASTIFALGTVSEALIILRANGVGVPLYLLPIIFLVFNLVYSILSIPAGALSDRIGHRNTYMIGMLIFIISYILFALVVSPFLVWFIFALYGVYAAFTDGVGRAIVADLVTDEHYHATAYGIYSASTAIAFLPGSIIFGLLWDFYGAPVSFLYGALMAIIALGVFAMLRFWNGHEVHGKAVI